MFHALARVVLRRRLLSGLLVAAVIAVFSAGAAGLTVDFSAKAFYGTDSPELDLMEQHQARFGSQENSLLVLVDGGGETVLTRERVEALDALGEDLRRSPLSAEVRSLADVQRISRPAPGVILPVPLVNAIPRDPERAEAWRAEIASDPALTPRLVSEDGAWTAMIVELSVDGDDIDAVRSAVIELDALVEAHEGTAGLSFQTSGIPAVRGGLMDVIIRDQLFFVTVSMVLIAIILILLFRSLHGLTVPLVAAIVPAMMVFGLMGWTDEPVGLINNAYATLLPVIAVADAIHMVTRFHEERRKLAGPGETLTKEQRKLAVTRAMGAIGAACLLTSVTTAIGFLSLNLATMRILKDFGLYAAAGIGFAYFTVLLIVPLGLSMVKEPVRRADGEGPIDRGLLACARFSTDRPRLTLGITALVVVFFVFFGTKVEVDNWLTGILPPEHPVTVANGVLDSELGGIVSVEYDLTGDLRSPESLQAMAAVADEVRTLPDVRGVESPASVVIGASTLFGGPPAVPEDPGFVNTILERAEESTRAVLVGDHGRLIVRTKDVGANAFKDLQDEVTELVVPPLAEAGITASITGVAVVAYEGVNAVTTDLRDSLGAAFLVIAVVITLLFRSLRTGLISLVPNALPLIVGYGTLGLMGWDLDPGPAVVFTVALGIAVDDSIHLLARFKEEQAEGVGWTAGIHRSVQHAGRAVFVTTVILCLGFGINVFSSFPSNRIFGAIGAVVIFTALLCDLFVLPALLQVARPRRA